MKSFSRIAAPLILMLKTTGSIGSVINLKKSEGEVGGDNVVDDMVDGGEATNLTKRKN